MNKLQIIKLLAKRCGTTERLANKVLNEFLQITSETIVNGDSVKLNNFGTISAGDYKERLARNPRNNQTLIVPQHKRVKFSIGKELREKLNPNFKTETIEIDTQPVIIL